MKELGEAKKRFSEIMTKLKDIAERHGISLYEIHKRTGIKRPTIYAWARQPEHIPLAAAKKIAREMGISVEELVKELSPELKP